MCLIVDNNVAHRVFSAVDDSDFKPVQNTLFAPKPKYRVWLVYGGRLKEEYFHSPAYRRLISQLDRAGRARLVADEQVDYLELLLVNAKACRSDDPHVIALAQASGARLLCSHDKTLHEDFTDPALLKDPRGKVYQTQSHIHLLRSIAKTCDVCRANRP